MEVPDEIEAIPDSLGGWAGDDPRYNVDRRGDNEPTRHRPRQLSGEPGDQSILPTPAGDHFFVHQSRLEVLQTIRKQLLSE